MVNGHLSLDAIYRLAKLRAQWDAASHGSGGSIACTEAILLSLPIILMASLVASMIWSICSKSFLSYNLPMFSKKLDVPKTAN